MFHSRRLPTFNRHQRITPGRAYPRFLTAIKGTLTPSYVLKLSSDPPITEVPCTQDRSCSSRLFVSRYTCAISSASAAYTRGLCHAVQFRTSQSPDFHRFTSQQGCSALLQLPFPCRPTPALGSDWVEGGLSPSSALFSRTSQRYPACS